LGRALFVAAGALGLGGAVKQSHASNVQAAKPSRGLGTELKLYGRNLHLHAAERRAGELPRKGDRHTAYAELLDRPEGAAVGHFWAAHLPLGSPFAAASSLEIHTFDLGDGTIHGLGSAARGSDGTFVVLGGTGTYSGATGSYLARLLP